MIVLGITPEIRIQIKEQQLGKRIKAYWKALTSELEELDSDNENELEELDFDNENDISRNSSNELENCSDYIINFSKSSRYHYFDK
ncbi:15702_t:CDS:2 [Dentiscutata erythropus]|uniref:15702_t:CDS:1 n=1 Tax=Dentiscutata erythropus TaxID=1348616 RepID=A0A9N9FQX4_9GLOM|nr:15702_t:CDS:2 [Dentiscutata erythropus]